MHRLGTQHCVAMGSPPIPGRSVRSAPNFASMTEPLVIARSGVGEDRIRVALCDWRWLLFGDPYPSSGIDASPGAGTTAGLVVWSRGTSGTAVTVAAVVTTPGLAGPGPGTAAKATGREPGGITWAPSA